MTMAITVAIAPAVCRIRPPIASANRPSTVRYKIPPMTARVTPGWPSVMATWLRRIAVVMKNTANTVIALTTRSSSGEHDGLGGQHREPVGHGEQRGADRAGGVLAGDHDHAEHADGQLAEAESRAEDHRGRVGEEPGVVGMVARRVPVVRDDRRDQGGKADRHDHEGEQRPHGGPDRADLRPFRAQQAAEAEPGTVRRPGTSDGCGSGPARWSSRAPSGWLGGWGPAASRAALAALGRRTRRCPRSAP